MATPYIVKASGERQRFSPLKLKKSLIKCGLPADEARETLREVTQRIVPDMSSRQIYDLTRRELVHLDRSLSYRYSLKRAIFDLGPNGFLFEQIIGRLMTRLGYAIKMNQMVEGKCIVHEVDVVAEQSGEIAWAECKFHNEQGVMSDLKTALYVYARYLDLKEHAQSPKQMNMWLVSNTKFSTDAITFSNCRGVKLLGWNHPENQGLNVLLERHRVYPITVATTLSRKHKLDLIRVGVLTTEDFQNSRNKVLRLGMPKRHWEELSSEFARLHEME